jgi:predicted N-acetyltransferase YhbS
VSGVELRRATVADADALVRNMLEGFATYREFAGREWELPDPDDALERTRTWFELADSWGLVAIADGEIVGHVAFVPAAAAGLHPADDPRLAHLGQLFVRQPWWGTGVAARLLRAATDEAAARGFERIRLFVASGYARGRRFYEREGFVPVAEPYYEPALRLEIVECAKRLAAPRGG